ncbi:unnamed protein product [Blepharisma stoltei]|uniref:Uncharacterized protein n=1 Tax=Blepharisma stoltei TaxID=1481888 RepID=A0AAU9KCQ6_9CILI|nr:unnamed protein product [Blepharisma stoltei]
MAKFLSFYNRSLNARPLLTKSISTFCTVGLGDALSQYIESKIHNRPFIQNFDFTRYLKLSLFGGFYLGPILHNWYGLLAVLFPQKGVVSTVKKVFLDQTLFSSFVICSFFTAVPLMNNAGLSAGVTKIKEDFWEALKMNWRIWPLAMVINFNFVPLHFQVLFVNFVALFWNSYLSYVTNLKK